MAVDKGSPPAMCAIRAEINTIVNPAYTHSLSLLLNGIASTTAPTSLATANSILKYAGNPRKTNACFNWSLVIYE